MNQRQLTLIQGFKIVGVIWLVGALSDRLWLSLDRSVPAWDQADYLNGALNYWQAIQEPHWLDSQWWRNLWLLSPKIPPLTYISTVPFLNLFGPSADAAMLVMLFYSALLLGSVYSLGAVLFNVAVGVWAAVICQVLPGLYRYRLEFLLDYPLTAVVTFSFCLLTLWKATGHRINRHAVLGSSSLLSWFLAIVWGLSLGVALMVKQTALFFLLIPTIWVLGETITAKNWHRLAQLIAGISLSICVFFPWYRTNWLLILTSGKRATLDSAIAEGDPPLTTLRAWTYYGEVLPYLLSWVLLLVPIVGLLIRLIRHQGINIQCRKALSCWTWLAVFLLGGYLLSSLNVNKDARYLLPLLPTLSLVLAVGMICWRRWRFLQVGTIGLATVLMVLNLFPLGGQALTKLLSPRVQHTAYLGQPLPHQKVVTEIINTSPFLRSTLGVLPSTPQINQHNFSFYGGKYNFQVVGRQVGVREPEVEQDARSLDWFLTKTGEQGSVPAAQAVMVALAEGADFQLQNSWPLPDRSTLKLYRRRQATIEVKPSTATQLQLEQVSVPKIVPPGVPIPVTYRWSGPWQQLQSGFVLLTWELVSTDTPLQSFWLHDHRVGLGALYSADEATSIEVIERTAMLADEEVQAGKYVLKATYLSRDGDTTPIAVPPVSLTIDPAASPPTAPELDLVTQLRSIAPQMATGITGLEPIFVQTARINQYDPIQDYLVQANQTLTHRLQQQPRLDWMYAIALSRVLQQDVAGAIAMLQQLVQHDDQNPYAYAYLAFVYLYNWQPHTAQAVLQPALALSDAPEIKTLSGIAALMQGNLLRAWHNLSFLLK
ncbi:MAG: phospholipid carrier-dependent glycosyltransferase [Cyanophyceae cyanobacterium]